MSSSLAKTDLEAVRNGVGPLWEKLRGKRIFITGGTGFFGSWLLESLIDADRELKLGVSAVVLTRDPEGFKKRAPHLAGSPVIELHAGDITSFSLPAGTFSHVIHAATEVAKFTQTAPLTVVDSVVLGTRRVLELTAQNPLQGFLYVSSGAVYGTQPTNVDRVPEDFPQAPPTLDLNSSYGHSKRLAEHMCALYAKQHGFPLAIARCFAFIGPYMPFESHLAAGAFIQTALERREIRIEGDGTPLRSYLYASDLAVWLWTLLLSGKPTSVYNVGSEATVSIGELAALTNSVVNPGGTISIAKTPTPGALPARYVPSVQRACKELGLKSTVPLEEAIRRTANWKRQQPETQIR